ncbi:hypothetical protein [uncultured Desulfobacter sp.]|uniref:hypothetical protein n=1 Tax=uncultured Desulfobacter sp. TaxID=240139 RepID=UPI002AAAFE25|nr:hypothetical protein [uncultured Desulfobacter sp.]
MGNITKNWDTIFKAGTHTSSNGQIRDWTTGDLDRLVTNTGEDAPIVIRHPKDQAQAVEFGKIARLRRFGTLLQAQYRDVPEILNAAVKEGLRLAKSVSIDPAKMIIRHVGLLGAGQDPAVDGLGPANFTAENGDDSLVTYTINQINFEKEDPMDPKDKEIQELKDKVKALETGNEAKALQDSLNHAKSDLETEKTAHEATKQEFETYKKDQADKALSARVDALAETGRILPADKAKTLAFAKAMGDGEATMEFSAPDGTKENITPRENYLRDLEARDPDNAGLLSEFAKPGTAGGTGAVDHDVFKDINSFA